MYNLEKNLFLRRMCEKTVMDRLQNEVICGNLALNEISDAEFEREVSEEMNKRTYLLELERRFGKGPEKIKGDAKGRYGWRVNGRKGYFPRAKTIEEVYDLQWNHHLQELEKIEKQNENYRLPLEKLIERYNKTIEKQKSSGTINCYKSDMNYYLNDLMKKPVEDFERDEIVNLFADAVATKHPCKTKVMNVRGTTKMYFKYAQKNLNITLKFDYEDLHREMIEKTPVESIKQEPEIQLLKQSSRSYSKDEVKAMINEAYKRNTLIAYASIISFFSSDRIGEISGLLVENVDREQGIIEIKTAFSRNMIDYGWELKEPKKHKERTIVLPTMAMDILEKIFELRNPESKYLFAEKDNTHKYEWITSKRIDREIRSMCRSIGMAKGKEKSAHDQRRTYAVILDSAALPSALRKLLMGHKLDLLERSYITDLDLDLEDVRKYLDLAFNKFFKDKKKKRS